MSDWDRHLQLARSGLAPAMPLVGDWIGEGRAHGEAVTASLRVRSVLSDTQLELWERVGDHEDVCFYRFDVGSGQLRVVHLMAGAVADHAVEASPDGLVWVTPPSVPAVVWSLRVTGAGEELRSEVFWPDQRVAEVEILYRRG